MKYDEWKDAEIMTMDGVFEIEKITINQYAWINALSINISLGIIAAIVLMSMFIALDGITLSATIVTAVVMIAILAVGTFFLKEDYVQEAVDEIQITEFYKNDEFDLEDEDE